MENFLNDLLLRHFGSRVGTGVTYHTKMSFFIYTNRTPAQAKDFAVAFINFKNFGDTVFMTPDNFAFANLMVLPEFSSTGSAFKCEHEFSSLVHTEAIAKIVRIIRPKNLVLYQTRAFRQKPDAQF